MMTPSQLATASLNDIVFDGRNKAYGAYELRLIYERHVSRALLIATALLMLLLLFPIISNLMRDPIAAPQIHTKPVDPINVEPVKVVIPEKIVPPPPAAMHSAPVVPTPPVATVRFVEPKISATATVSDIPDVKELLGKDIGHETTAGDISLGGPVTPVATGKGGDGLDDVLPSSTPYTYVEQMPELPGGGGMQAIVNAIQKAVRYPGMELRNGIEGKVYASFTVSPLGEIMDIKIVKSVSEGIDNETLRAIKTLPKFIPGKQNGRAVSVSFTVPISFKIQ